MSELTRDVFVAAWRMAKAGQACDDADLARMQKFMGMHEDLHPYFDRMAADPQAPVEIEGENLMLHIAMDASTEVSLERDEPAGIRQVMQGLLDAGVDPGRAFHVIAQAMTHSAVQAAGRGEELSLEQFLALAQAYSAQIK